MSSGLESADAECHWRQLWAASALQFDDQPLPGLASEIQQDVVGTSLPREDQTLVGQPPGRAPEIRDLELTASNPISPSNEDSASSPRFPWTLALIAAWAAGIVLLVGRSAWNYARVVRQMPPVSEVDPEWSAEWLALQRQAGIRRNVPLAVAEHAGPVLFRLPRGYRLVVPGDAWRTLQSPHAWRSCGTNWPTSNAATSGNRSPCACSPCRTGSIRWRGTSCGDFDECAEWACDEAARRAVPRTRSRLRPRPVAARRPGRARVLRHARRRAQGLSFRIRRLLTPTQEKGSTMKTVSTIVLVLGFSLANLTRLQTRADDSSAKAVNLTVTAAPQGATTALTVTAIAAPAAAITPAPAQSTSAASSAAPATPVGARRPPHSRVLRSQSSRPQPACRQQSWHPRKSVPRCRPPCRRRPSCRSRHVLQPQRALSA